MPAIVDRKSEDRRQENTLRLAAAGVPMPWLNFYPALSTYYTVLARSRENSGRLQPGARRIQWLKSLVVLRIVLSTFLGLLSAGCVSVTTPPRGGQTRETLSKPPLAYAQIAEQSWLLPHRHTIASQFGAVRIAEMSLGLLDEGHRDSPGRKLVRPW